MHLPDHSVPAQNDKYDRWERLHNQYSPKRYAPGRIANSSNEKLKALCVFMLNYGAAAQNTAMYGYYADQYFAD